MKQLVLRNGYLFLFMLLMLSSCNTGNLTDIQRLLSPAALPYLKSSKLIQVSSYDTTGGNNDRITIAPGAKAIIFNVDGPGMISRIWFTIDSRDPFFLRHVVIRMYWDHEKNPSVEVPLGDFFGSGFKYQPYISQYLGMTSGGYICYLPMPFERHARIEISNDTPQEIYAFYYQIDYQKFEGALESDVAYFHALWKRDVRTNYDSNYVVLNAEGRGHIVGVNMNLQSYDGSFGYLEGDEMVYVDGERKPSIHGTGTEDFFSGGWYFNRNEFAGPYSGLIYKNDTTGQIAAFRLLIPDPIPFKKSIKFTIEHGHGNQEIADYSSTVYWYQMEPHKPFPPFPVAGQRTPLRVMKPAKLIEAEKLKFQLNGQKSKVMDMSEFGPEWGDNRQILIEAHDKSTFGLTINGLKEAQYDITLYYTLGPDYGNADIFINNQKTGEINGYSLNTLPIGKTILTGLQHVTGLNSIDIKFVITGKDPASKGFNIGLDGLRVTPKRDFIPAWYILGPFPNPRKSETDRRGLDSVYLPESVVDLTRLYFGIDGKPIRWKFYNTPVNGYFSLNDKIEPSELVVTYVVTYIYSPDNRKISFFIGSDDGIKVFFNDNKVYRYTGTRAAEPDQAEMELKMKPGWNKLLLKIENNFGGYGFYARVLDRENKLIINPDQKKTINVKR
ncbi:MAG: DUF2961 domain-containing protein [Bacteroidales bacterium]|jgi:hypothetical protein|nr:DUF2961 domain-containing protein [Bacteroidales bacterium]